jgi:CHAD domain-containing protein
METKLNVKLSVIADLSCGYLDIFLKNYAALLKRNNLENVHEARISSRRLRASLLLLSLIKPNNDYRKFSKYFKKIGRLLGMIREVDVQISFLKSLQIKPSDKELIDNLVRYLINKRSKAYKTFRKASQNKHDKIILKLKNCFKVLQHDAGLRLNIDIEILLIKHINKLLSYNIHKYNKLHKMRITAKKLRYTLELLKPFNGNIFDTPISYAHKIQDVLGDLREMDIFLDFLKKNMASKKSRLYKVCLIKQKSAYVKFLHLWAAQRNNGIWKNLRKMMLQKRSGSY